MNGSPPTTFVKTGDVSDPVIQTATWDGTHDYAMYAALFANKTKLNSTGFNAAWKISERLDLEIDAHTSQVQHPSGQPLRLRQRH